MHRNRYLEEQKELTKQFRDKNWFAHQQMRWETVREPEEEIRRDNCFKYIDKDIGRIPKDEIFADVDENIFWYD